MYQALRPLIFRLDPESAHNLTLYALRLAGSIPPLRFALHRIFAAPKKPVRAFGLPFQNPVGLAAGYDKDGLAWRGLACLGFGHLEIGTVTPRPQPGNPKPRVFRLAEDNGLINRLGFPSRGKDYVVQSLQGSRPPGLVLGVNLGKNKDTPNEEAAHDYLTLMHVCASLADYLVINVSSPNTIGLRRLQAHQVLEALLTQLDQKRKIERHRLRRNIPLLVKLAPDLTDQELDDALDAILRTRMDGVIATNTTIRRNGLRSPHTRETGGLSGAPLTSYSTETVTKIHLRTGGKLPIIGVGGIMSPADARAMLDAGATLVQVYTGLIYTGPGLVKRILADL